MRHSAGGGNAGRAWLLRHNLSGYGNRCGADVAFNGWHGERLDPDMARKAKKLFTIGYEQTPPKAVLDELENAGVKLLVDVRAVAASRRPGFSKNQLAAGLDERGISYLHLRALGTPKDGRDAARNGKFEALHKIYAAQEELDELSSLVRKSGPVCILCYERDHRHCHRQWIAEIIEARDGVKVENLVAPQI
jgi:uncharacterized protein (DUF488 family)